MEEALSDVESVYQEVAVSEETGRVKEVSEVNEEKKEEVSEVKEEVSEMKEEKEVSEVKEEKKEEEVPQRLVIREFADSVLPFLPLNMTLLEKEQGNKHWVFDKWECDENCRCYSTVAAGVEYNTAVYDVKRTITSPLYSTKTADSLTVLYGGKEYYIIPQGKTCTVLRRQIIKVYDSGCDS